MATFDEVRKRQGELARARVLHRVSSPLAPTQPASHFDAVRNRSAAVTGLPAVAPVSTPSGPRAPEVSTPPPLPDALGKRGYQLPEQISMPEITSIQKTAAANAKNYTPPADASPARGQRLIDIPANVIEGAYDLSGFGLLGDAQRRIGDILTNIGAMSPEEAQEIEENRAERKDTTAYKVGQFAGYILPGAAIERGVAAVARPLIQNLPRAGRLAITGGAAGAIEAAAQEGADAAFRQETFDPLNVAIGAAAGGAIGAVAPAVGQGVQRLLRVFRPQQAAETAATQVTESAAAPILALPEPRTRGNVNRAQPPDVIPAAGRVEPIGLPEPDIAPPTTARVARQVNPYRVKLEAFAREMEGVPLPPGRERETLLEAWGRYADREDPDLETMIDLAYPSRPNRITPDLVQRARETQRMREVAGVGMPVRSFADRYQQGQVAPAASPITTAGRSTAAGGPTVSSPLRARTSEPSLQSAPQRSDVPEEPALSLEEELARMTDDDFPFYDSGRRPDDIADDIADDIELPQPDEVAPRVRDRINSYADSLIASGRAELARNRNRLSSMPADIYYQYAKIGAGYMLKGAVKLADFTEQLVRDFGEEIRPYARAIFANAKKQYEVIRKRIENEELGLNGIPLQQLKDVTNINLNTADVYRNFRKVFGEHYPSVKRAILDPFDKAKGSYAAEQKALTDKLYNDIVRGLGIRKGSKESALVQQYGEGQITLDQLKEMAPNSWEKIVKADRWFREQYDDLLQRVNGVIAQIYPNRPEKLVPRRTDYYRHFREISGWSGLVNLFDTPSGISPSLAGISPFTKPKTKWASFKQRRGLGEFKNDAVGGFLEYIPAASYAIHIDPHISVFRNFAKRLRQETETIGNINRFIQFLENYANDLAGKTSTIDRVIDEYGGRRVLRVLTWFNNRVKSNVILGNVRSTLSQLANIPNGIAFGGQDAPAGALRTIQSLFEPNLAMEASDFLRERYLDKSFRRFNQRWWEQPRRFAEAMMEISDRVGTTFVWNTAYVKAVRENIQNPVKYADEQTRRLVGGRGVGEQPLLIKTKMFNLVFPFQLEVNNLWRVMKDFVDEKRFGALVTLFVSNWLLNKAFEATTGSGVVFDPLDAVIDAVTEEDVSILQRGGRLAGEIFSNLPGGQILAAVYPEYGAGILPTRKEFFGDKDPTRFGVGILATRGLTDPVFNFILPFGGNQLKKAIQGTEALIRGGAYTENITTIGPELFDLISPEGDEKSKLRFPVATSPLNIPRAALFGPYATSEGQEFTREDRRPLSETQTRRFQALPQGQRQEYYDALMTRRRRETEREKQRNR